MLLSDRHIWISKHQQMAGFSLLIKIRRILINSLNLSWRVSAGSDDIHPQNKDSGVK